jgi:hypothetical protein
MRPLGLLYLFDPAKDLPEIGRPLEALSCSTGALAGLVHFSMAFGKPSHRRSCT